MRQYRAELLACLVLVTITLAVYARVGTFDFVDYDDHDYVLENAHVKAGLTRDGVIWAFATTPAANWHPLTWLSLQLDAQLFGLRAGGFHFTNLLLHVANTVLLFLALRRMTGAAAVGRCAMVAALFAVHPLHVESVAWVSERKDVLSAFFWMLTLVAYAWYAERPSVGRYLLVFLFYALGLMAKPMLVTLPCVLLLLDWWPLRRLGWWADKAGSPDPEAHSPAKPKQAPAWWLLLEKVPLFGLTAASCAATLYAQQAAMWSTEALPIQLRLQNSLTSYLGYIGKTICPLWLAALYPYRVYRSVAIPLGCGALLLAITAVVLWRARRQPYLGVGWFWYLGTLVPVIGLVQVGRQAMADRYTYIPSIGLFLLLVWGANDLLARSPRRRAWLAALGTIVLVPCLILTWFQTATWRNGKALWQHAVAVTNDNAEAYTHFGSYLAAEGQVEQALAHYRRALQISPDDWKAQYLLGALLYKQGKLNEAAAHLASAARLNPELPEPEARFVMGMICLDTGNAVQARHYFTRTLELNPSHAQAHNNLGVISVKDGKMAEAVEHFSAAVRSNPNYVLAYCNLGKVLFTQGNYDAAEAAYQAALRLQPDNTRAREGLAEIRRVRGPK